MKRIVFSFLFLLLSFSVFAAELTQEEVTSYTAKVFLSLAKSRALSDAVKSAELSGYEVGTYLEGPITCTILESNTNENAVNATIEIIISELTIDDGVTISGSILTDYKSIHFSSEENSSGIIITRYDLNMTGLPVNTMSIDLSINYGTSEISCRVRAGDNEYEIDALSIFGRS